VGDVCTIRHGQLNFVSRKYQTHIPQLDAPSRWERVTLRMDRFHGAGTYHRGTVTLVTAHTRVFQSQARVVRVLRATSREVVAEIDAGREPANGERGTPFHIFGTARCRVRR
jgi:hypothetical protein